MLEFLQVISILLEAVIVIFGLILFVQKKKKYGLGIALTFGIYVIYDFSKFLNLAVPSDALYVIFFVATASIFWAVWTMYKEM